MTKVGGGGAVANECLLVQFLEQGTEALNGLELDGVVVVRSRSEIRSLLLEIQLSTLRRVVEEHNNKNNHNIINEQVCVSDIQAQLKSLTPTTTTTDDDDDEEDDNNKQRRSLGRQVELMNQAARQAFARLVLYSAWVAATDEHAKEEQPLRRTCGGFQRKDILEFCGLVQSSLQLPHVQKYLNQGTPLFPAVKEAPDAQNSWPHLSSSSPLERLQYIQSIFFQSLQYDPTYAQEEWKRLAFDDDEPQYAEFRNDEQVTQAISQMMVSTRQAIIHANNKNNNNIVRLSDLEDGGVTRVVGVHYSETVMEVDENAQMAKISASPLAAAPLQEIIAEHDEEEESSSGSTTAARQQQQQKQANQIHVAAAQLQHEILMELRNTNEQDRNAKLIQAEQTAREFLRHVASLPPENRIECLRSIDPSTQRLMIMHRLGETMKLSSSSMSSES